MLDKTIPPSVTPFLESYLKALEPLQARLYGIYLHGSIALDAFEEGKSDIDAVALTQGEWSKAELAQLEAIHAKLVAENELGRKLEVIYVPRRALGKYEVEPYPRAADGKFIAAHQRQPNAVMWWIVQHNGIRLYGPERAELGLDLPWQDVLEAMRYNLEGYWARKAKKQPYLFLFDYWIEFAVSTLCRILTTVEEGKIIAKSPAIMYWRDRLPARFQPLLDEARRIRYDLRPPSFYRFRVKRMRETLAFISYVRHRCGNKIELQSTQRTR